MSDSDEPVVSKNKSHRRDKRKEFELSDFAGSELNQLGTRMILTSKFPAGNLFSAHKFSA